METLTVESLQPETEFTAEIFWSKWGESTGLTPEQFGRMWQDSETWYINLPYHNFLHAREVLWESMRIADECEAEGKEINRKVLVAAALFHDAGYYLDHTNFGFEDKESFSAGILGMYAQKYEMTTEQLRLAQGAIRATKLGTEVLNDYDSVLVEADIANAGDDYETSFLYKKELFRREIEIIKHSGVDSVDPTDFSITSIKILCVYLSQNLRPEFRERALANLRHLSKDIALAKGENIIEFGHNLGDPAEHLLALDAAA